ncbi:hypothetical protein PanWU01x14_229590, partial [Parasponia andersonii]
MGLNSHNCHALMQYLLRGHRWPSSIFSLTLLLFSLIFPLLSLLFLATEGARNCRAAIDHCQAASTLDAASP